MSSAVDLVNTALSHLGSDTVVLSLDPPDGTVEAGLGARFFPVARAQLLSLFEWNFAITRSTLAPVASPPGTVWRGAYAVPADCLKPWRVLDVTSQDDADGVDFRLEGQTILTNGVNPVLMYSKDITNLNLFTPTFNSTLSFLLASYMAGPLIRGAAGAQTANQFYQRAVEEAKKNSALDANSAGSRRAWEIDFVPSAIRARA